MDTDEKQMHSFPLSINHVLFIKNSTHKVARADKFRGNSYQNVQKVQNWYEP